MDRVWLNNLIIKTSSKQPSIFAITYSKWAMGLITFLFSKIHLF